MTEQNKELFIEFVNFCESQPADKKINHDSWNSCAVGEFFGWNDWKDINFGKIVSLLGQEGYSEEPCTLYAFLNTKMCPNTYGEFTKFLKQYL